MEMYKIVIFNKRCMSLKPAFRIILNKIKKQNKKNCLTVKKNH